MLQGASLTVREEVGKRFAIVGAYILGSDLQIKRLILHTIDSDLMPPPQ